MDLWLHWNVKHKFRVLQIGLPRETGRSVMHFALTEVFLSAINIFESTKCGVAAFMYSNVLPPDKYSTNFVFRILFPHILLQGFRQGVCMYGSLQGIYSNYFLWTPNSSGRHSPPSLATSPTISAAASEMMLATHVPQLTKINSWLGNQKLIVHQAKANADR